MRALIVGAGSAGRRHARTLAALEPASEIAFLRRNPRPDAPELPTGARAVTSLEAALDPRPAFAVVATPSALHLESLLPLVEARIPFYVEKPVVATRDQLAALERALDRASFAAPTFAGCNLRLLPSLRKLRDVLQSGAAGRVVRASLQAGQWLPDWRPGQDYRTGYSADPERGGGVILDLLHELDAARWLLGEFDVVRGLAGKLSSLEIRSEDTAALLLGRKGGGTLVTVGLDYVSRRRVRRYEFVGDRATLTWDLAGESLSLARADGDERIDAGPGAFDVAATHVAAMREFLEGVRSGRATSQDVREGMRSAELAIRAKEAAAS